MHSGAPGSLVGISCRAQPDWRRCLSSNIIDRRAALLDSALRLSFLTIAWNGVVGGTALVLSFLDDSLALAAFALNALLDASASAVLIWRFRKEQRDPVAAEHLERRHRPGSSWRWAWSPSTSGCRPSAPLSRLAPGSVGLRSDPRRPLPDRAAVAWEAEAARRRRPGESGPSWRRSSDARGCDAGRDHLTALLQNSTLGWWWADPLAALLIAVALATEAVRIAVRHRFG